MKYNSFTNLNISYCSKIKISINMKTKLQFLAILFFILNTTSLLFAQQNTYRKVFYDLSGSAQAFSTVKTYDNNFL